MRFDELLKSAGVETCTDDTEISGLEIDSRKCKAGSLYFAINGTRTDGHDYIKSAYENGAVAAIVERTVDCDIKQIKVENTRSAMSYIASAFYGHPSKKLRMIGVTGTNGKTSISYMIKAIARENNISCGIIGTGGIYLDDTKLDISFLTATTPDPIELQYILSEMVKHGAKWVVMEVTAHALDLHKIDGMQFASGGFTNLTQDHLDYFGTMENYARAKESFFVPELVEKAIINIDDDFGKKLYENRKIPCMSCSLHECADLHTTNIRIHAACTELDIMYKNNIYPVKLKTTGMFNVSNALCAIGCALASGVCINGCIRGIEQFTSVPGRFEAVDTKDTGITVIVDYAHTPDGIENLLNAINGFKQGRLICVFGCGGNRDDKKRPIMGEIAGRLSDYCVLTSDNPRFEEPEKIIDQIEAGIKRTDCAYIRNADRRQAIALALEYAQKDDIIAICGKGDEDYQEIKGEKHHFSDREVVNELI